MKIYRKRFNGIYIFLLVSSIALSIAMPIAFIITKKIAIAGLPGLFVAIAITVTLYRTQKFVTLSDTHLVIASVRKNNSNISYNLKEIDAVLFERVFMNGYRIGIKQGRVLDTYEINLLSSKEIKRLKQDLLLQNIKIR